MNQRLKLFLNAGGLSIDHPPCHLHQDVPERAYVAFILGEAPLAMASKFLNSNEKVLSMLDFVEDVQNHMHFAHCRRPSVAV